MSRYKLEAPGAEGEPREGGWPAVERLLRFATGSYDGPEVRAAQPRGAAFTLCQACRRCRRRCRCPELHLPLTYCSLLAPRQPVEIPEEFIEWHRTLLPAAGVGALLGVAQKWPEAAHRARVESYGGFELLGCGMSN